LLSYQDSLFSKLNLNLSQAIGILLRIVKFWLNPT